jgi:hypothetical protein
MKISTNRLVKIRHYAHRNEQGVALQSHTRKKEGVTEGWNLNL